MPLVAIGRGHPRTPTALKGLRGRVQRVNPKEPKLDPREIPPAPEGLDEVETGAWEELRAIVNPLRVTTSTDLVAFKLLVEALATARRAAAALRKDGITVQETGGRGQTYLRPRPEVNAMVSAQKLVWYGLSRFGATPADRGRVDAMAPAGPAPEDEFAQ